MSYDVFVEKVKAKVREVGINPCMVRFMDLSKSKDNEPSCTKGDLDRPHREPSEYRAIAPGNVRFYGNGIAESIAIAWPGHKGVASW